MTDESTTHNEHQNVKNGNPKTKGVTLLAQRAPPKNPMKGTIANSLTHFKSNQPPSS